MLEQYNFAQPPQHKFELNCLNDARGENKAIISCEAKNQFQTLIEKTTAAILVLQENKIIYANHAAVSIMSYLQLQLLTNLEFCHQLNSNKRELDSPKSNYCEEFETEIKENEKRWLKYCWETIEWENQLAVMVTVFDISKYKQEEVNTKQALIAEKAISQNKIKFVSMVSHEFRTPLNIISFSTSLLKRHLNQWSEAKKLKYLDRLQGVVEKLGKLIDEVLIIGKAEAGKLKFDPQPFDLHLFCHDLSIEINLSHITDRPTINFIDRLNCQFITGDRDLLKLVLSNLLDNAIKYSPAKQPIEFVVSNKDEQIIFQVTDRGIGIPVKDRAEIFEPFHRSSNVGDLPGNGLGLAIVKRVVELQNGQISLESELNKGSTFTVKIPLKLA